MRSYQKFKTFSILKPVRRSYRLGENGCKLHHWQIRTYKELWKKPAVRGFVLLYYSIYVASSKGQNSRNGEQIRNGQEGSSCGYERAAGVIFAVMESSLLPGLSTSWLWNGTIVFFVLFLFLFCFLQDIPFQGNWTKHTWDFSQKFLTTACESTVIIIEVSIKNIKWVVNAPGMVVLKVALLVRKISPWKWNHSLR